ncbi:MAG TPA: 3-dehydroquinate synthase [Sedimentisphaerales bacterium]|nr:3-dehydroquinate synthase [Sedimentisphaerales bacterium]HRS13121.1 3-dehydroquinate synthase [Sedimentisphaerales bacterium]HRV49686.1 3-dehydroquinate synthase [Sedimentisphaerales bacterium]
MHELEIKVPAPRPGSYKVTIGTGLLAALWSQIKAGFGHCRPFLITDANVVAAGHLDTLLGGRPVPHFIIDPPGEVSKTITTAVTIVEAMEKAYLGRDTLVVALGGGTVGDVAGFAAAIFKRGVPVVQIPTTTLAQADSAIGGKTGVDSSVSKNAFGAFWHPAAVYVDVATVQTLEERQYRSGLVESVKHALIADADYFEFLEQQMDAILGRQSEVLQTLGRHNCTIKGRIVEADPDERNQRRMLNYGHTIGHAVESASNYRLLHGEAIAIGIVAAGRIEIEMGLSEPRRLERVTTLLSRLGVPVTLPSDLDAERLIDLLRHDKKAVDRWPRCILLNQLGRVHCPNGQFAVDVDRRIVEKVITSMVDNR